MVKKKLLQHGEGKKHGKRTPQPPQTADEFLAAGVDFEEAGEKWRAGDAVCFRFVPGRSLIVEGASALSEAKSCRFFVRALETYQTGLQQFPTSFDLAYNRARLQFELVEQPRLAAFLPQSKDALLDSALEHSRYCLSLDGDDADALYNTGQVLSSIADYLTDEVPSSEPRCIELLEEAVVMFGKCFTIQQAAYIRQREEVAAIAADPSAFESESSAVQPAQEAAGDGSSSGGDEWAAVVEPLTDAVLVDTCKVKIEALTALVPLVATKEDALTEIRSIYAEAAGNAAAYLPSLDDTSQVDWAGADANLVAALTGAAFGLGRISAQEYAQELDRAYGYTGVESTVGSLCDVAESRIAFNEAVAAAASQLNAADHESLLGLRWHQLSTALDALGMAAKLPNVPSPWNIHEKRAEVELLRAMMGVEPAPFPQASTNRGQLLKNAEVYFRGAKNSAHTAGESEVEREMGEKEGVVQMLRGERPEDQSLKEMYEEMRDDGLMP